MCATAMTRRILDPVPVEEGSAQCARWLQPAQTRQEKSSHDVGLNLSIVILSCLLLSPSIIFIFIFIFIIIFPRLFVLLRLVPTLDHRTPASSRASARASLAKQTPSSSTSSAHDTALPSISHELHSHAPSHDCSYAPLESSAPSPSAMAPPPSSSLPLQQRLIQLVQTLQYAWFVGHVTLLFCILRYGLSYLTFNYYSRWAIFSYRTAFVSAAATYGIVVYKAFRARARSGSKAISPVGLLADENVQYLAMALVWLFSPQYPLAMLPFGVYSIFHVATYTRTNLIPTLQPGETVAPASPSGKATTKPNPLANTIGNFVKQYYDASMGLVAILEILLWGRLLLSAITFAKGSWILITIYTAFLRSRYAQSSFVQGQFSQLVARIDSVVGGQSTPPAARQVWDTVKGVGRQFHDATDLGKYTGGASPQKKAS